MTEAEWNTCADPVRRLEFLRTTGRGSQRKLRLLACACVSQILPLAKLLPEVTRSALAEVVQYADRGATKAAMKRVRERMSKARALTPSVRTTADDFVCYAIEYASTEKLYFRYIRYSARVLQHWRGGLVVGPQINLFRCIFGNIFRPAAQDPVWLTWNDGTVGKMAQSIYDDHTFHHLPLVADALEDAGCTDADILGHCRRPGEHVRGCWGVDLLLGKT